MDRSLSVLLPTYNGQAVLESRVTRLLEVLPDLTRRFAILIVDDASTDATVEIGHDLATRYPQVSIVRHPARLGLAEAIQTGLDMTSGETIFVHDGHSSFDIFELARLWRAACEGRSTAAATPVAPAGAIWWVGALIGWLYGTTEAPQAPAPAFTMLRRRAIEQLSRTTARHRIASPHILQLYEGDVAAAAAMTPTALAWPAATRADQAQHGTNRSERPNILRGLRRLALGR